MSKAMAARGRRWSRIAASSVRDDGGARACALHAATPPSANLDNFMLYTQSACLGNASLAETITSNGIVGKIGSL